MSTIESDFIEEILPALICLRQEIHSQPDLSARESTTAARLRDYLTPFAPDYVHEGLGGCGLAVVFAGDQPGPTTVFTCELDAVPITEQRRVAYCSQVTGAAHMCGHDGHMAAIAGLGTLLGQQRPARGQVVLLFRPQEETGLGAPAVVDDPRITKLKPDTVFGFHNLPGYPLGTLVYRRGLFAWAATDFVVELIGKSSHGGQPGAGRSPAKALAQIIEQLESIADWSGLDIQRNASQTGYAQLGESDHGTTPGYARLRATLRSQSNRELEKLCQKIDRMAADIAQAHGLQCQNKVENWIPATRNHERVVEQLLTAAREAGLPTLEAAQAHRWSDDFGVLTQHYPGAFFGLGSGDACGQLHGPDFDFPDAILEPALRLLWKIVGQLHGPVDNETP